MVMKWPSWMPRPAQSGYDGSPVDRRIKTDMEMGSVIRVEFDTDETNINCEVMLTQIQSAFLESFERDLLRQGTTWFEMPILIGGIVKNHLVQFKDRPKQKGVYGLHTVYSLSLNVSERKLWPSWLTELFLYYDPESLMKIASRLHYILHTQAPRVSNPEPFWE